MKEFAELFTMQNAEFMQKAMIKFRKDSQASFNLWISILDLS